MVWLCVALMAYIFSASRLGVAVCGFYSAACGAKVVVLKHFPAVIRSYTRMLVFVDYIFCCLVCVASSDVCARIKCMFAYFSFLVYSMGKLFDFKNIKNINAQVFFLLL